MDCRCPVPLVGPIARRYVLLLLSGMLHVEFLTEAASAVIADSGGRKRATREPL
jgi:hypothetical protein